MMSAVQTSRSGKNVELRPGRVLSVQTAGAAGAAATFLFCHGAGGSKKQWRSIWNLLAGPDTHLAAWDFPGHGASDDAKDPSAYAGAAMVEDWLTLFDVHRGPRTVVVGHSYGTRVTLAGLSRLQAPGRLGEVKAAVLLAPPPPAMSMAQGPLARWPLPLLVLARPWLARAFSRVAWSPLADPALVRAEEAATRRNGLSMMRALMRGAPTLQTDALDRLHLPVTILAGADDRLTPPPCAQNLAALLPCASVQVIAGCGHQIMLENPASVLAALRAASA